MLIIVSILRGRQNVDQVTFGDHMTVMIIEFIVIGYTFCGRKVV